MKHLAFLFCTMALLLLQACYCCDAPQPVNYIFAERNGASWKALPDGAMEAGDTVTIYGAGINGYGSNLHDTLGFKFKYAGTGNYQVGAGTVFYHSALGNGNSLFYKMDASFSNSLVISSYNPAKKLITGSFHLKFDNPADTSTVTFLNGNFTAPLK